MGVLDFVGWTERKITPQELTLGVSVWSLKHLKLGGAPNGAKQPAVLKAVLVYNHAVQI